MSTFAALSFRVHLLQLDMLLVIPLPPFLLFGSVCVIELSAVFGGISSTGSSWESGMVASSA